jgi:hypothetical protein
LEFNKRFAKVDKTGFITYPTKMALKIMNPDARVKAIASIEKQKRIIASLKAEIRADALTMKKEMERKIENARIRSEEFDRDSAKAEIAQLLATVSAQ